MTHGACEPFLASPLARWPLRVALIQMLTPEEDEKCSESRQAQLTVRPARGRKRHTDLRATHIFRIMGGTSMMSSRRSFSRDCGSVPFSRTQLCRAYGA